MSGVDFYLNKGFTPQWRYVQRDAAGTIAIWTPTTSTKVVLTGLQITNNNAAATLEITWGNLNINNRRIFVFDVAASTTIYPIFNVIEGTMYDRAIFCNASADASDGWKISAQGFELP